MTGITIRAVQELEPGKAIWDAGHREAVRGFGVRRQRGLPTYVVKYRVFGRQRFLTIGTHGSPWTPEKARKEAKRLLGLVADGKDPADEKTQARLQAADTLRKIIDQYLTHAAKAQRPRSYAETERALLKAFAPLHPVSVFNLRRSHITNRVSEIETERGPVAARKARAALSAMFNWAIREGIDIPANPVLGTNKPVEAKSRERVLTPAELKAIWSECGDDDYGRIVRLLMLTAQRRDEVGGMQWSEINGDLWTLPSSRTKNHREHTLPFTDAALGLLPERRGDFVFGSGPRKAGDPHRGFSGWSKAKAELDTRITEALRKVDPEAKPLAPWTLHDLRRTAATMMADRGVLPHVVEAILNHVSGHKAGVAGVYNRARYEAEMREALKDWADYVAELTRPIATRPKSLRLVRRSS